MRRDLRAAVLLAVLAKAAGQPAAASCQAFAKFMPSIWEDLAPYAEEGISRELMDSMTQNLGLHANYPTLTFVIRGGQLFVAGAAPRGTRASAPTASPACGCAPPPQAACSSWPS